MNSKIAKSIKMSYSPVAILFSADKPEGALQFKEGTRGCVIAMLKAAAKGRAAVFNRNTFGDLGGGVGLGFGNQFVNFPGGIEHFLSTGNKDFTQTDLGRNISRNMPALEQGEGYKKSPALAKKFVEALPMREVPATYVVFKPLESLLEIESPEVVVFLVNPDQLSALVVLAHYDSETFENVVAPFGAGCHTIGIIPFDEGKRQNPRAIIGLTDISARKQVEKNILSFTVPYKMYLEMESNVEGSFLEKKEWLKILERID